MNPLQSMRAEVIAGLRQPAKQVSSKFLYDAAGETMFRQIMELPEYYLTRSESTVFELHSAAIVNAITKPGFDVVELGAGDGRKTMVLLKQAIAAGRNVRYVPIDIARSALDAAVTTGQQHVPSLQVLPVEADYLAGLRQLHAGHGNPELILFLGSNIGNYSTDDARALLTDIKACVAEHDRLLVGFDLRKNPRVIDAAYNDSAGITRDFNLNLLARFNRELRTNFDLQKFDHYEHYDPVTGCAMSYLVSQCKQSVSFPSEDAQGPEVVIDFDQWELVHTETSRKYNLTEIQALAHASGWDVVDSWTDASNDQAASFVDVMFAPLEA